MNKLVRRFAGAFCGLLLMFTQAFAQQPDGVVPTFGDYEFHQFITSSGASPQSIVKLDNNGELVLAGVGGKTRAQWQAAGIEFAESQIMLLKAWRLLEEQEDVLRTTFPILNAEKTNELRRYSRALAPTLNRRLKPDILRFIGVLDAMGRKENTYTLLFSYVLDDLVWDHLSEQGLLGEREITAETPFWAGEVWATYPPRSFSMGTNTVADRGIALKVNWTKKALPKMMPFVADWENLLRLFNDYVEKGYAEDEQAKAVFAPFALFDDAGRFTVPVIQVADTDSLYVVSSLIAENVAREASTLLDLPGLTEKFGFRDEEQTLVVLYHDLMWDMMDDLEKEGLVRKPVAFASPEQAEPANIGDLVFIVRMAQ